MEKNNNKDNKKEELMNEFAEFLEEKEKKKGEKKDENTNKNKKEIEDRISTFVLFVEEKSEFTLEEKMRDDRAGIVKLVGPKAPFSWGWFLFWLIFTLGIFWIFYLIYHWAKKDCTVILRFNKDGWCTKIESSQGSKNQIIRDFYKEFPQYSQGEEASLKDILIYEKENKKINIRLFWIIFILVVLLLASQIMKENEEMDEQIQQNKDAKRAMEKIKMHENSGAIQGSSGSSQQ